MPASAQTLPMPFSTPTAWSAGVEAVLARQVLPLSSSTSRTSVNVPADVDAEPVTHEASSAAAGRARSAAVHGGSADHRPARAFEMWAVMIACAHEGRRRVRRRRSPGAGRGCGARRLVVGEEVVARSADGSPRPAAVAAWGGRPGRRSRRGRPGSAARGVEVLAEAPGADDEQWRRCSTPTFSLPAGHRPAASRCGRSRGSGSNDRFATCAMTRGQPDAHPHRRRPGRRRCGPRSRRSPSSPSPRVRAGRLADRGADAPGARRRHLTQPTRGAGA